MSWILLIIAGIIEIFGAMALKKFATTSNKIYLLAIAFLFVFSFSALSVAMQEIPLGVAYAVWTGIGSGGIVIVGIFFFKESKKLSKLFFLSLILSPTIALKLIG